ncbi:MAG: hypothetical protein R2752_08915, partial [Vicinamibacterales bacterium]
MNRPAPGPVPIHVRPRQPDAAPVARRGEPVTFGVPLPEAAFADAGAWALTDADGRTQAVQTRTLERWRDGSVRWLLVDARVDHPGDPDRAVTYHLAPAAAAVAPGQVLVVSRESGGAVRVRTGATSIRCAPGPALWTSDDTGLRTVTLTVTDRAGTTRTLAVRDVTVIDEGPLRVRLGLRMAPPDGELADLDTWVRLDAYAGQAAVRVSVRLRNLRSAEHPGGFWDLGGAGSLLLKDVSLHVETRDASAPLSLSTECGAPAAPVDRPVELYQDSSGGERWRSPAHVNRDHQVPLQFRGYRVRAGTAETSGLRATPILTSDGAAPVAVAVPDFWQNF